MSKVRNRARTFIHAPGWKIIGEKSIYLRSTWELKYGRYLQFLKERGIIADWLYEPETFWFNEIKRGVRSYLPDFKVILPDGSHYWAEVKGYMDGKSKTKIKRFNKYYPKEELQVIDAKWFKESHICGLNGKTD
jgi:hypothetical protein